MEDELKPKARPNVCKRECLSCVYTVCIGCKGFTKDTDYLDGKVNQHCSQICGRWYYNCCLITSGFPNTAKFNDGKCCDHSLEAPCRCVYCGCKLGKCFPEEAEFGDDRCCWYCSVGTCKGISMILAAPIFCCILFAHAISKDCCEN